MAAIEPVVRQDEEWSLRVDFSAVPLTTDQFYRLCIDNPELRLELTAEGELILMSPTGAKTGHRSSELIYQLVGWAKKDGKGLTFDSSPVFALPDGAKRSPDASWVSKERWEAISEEEQEKIAPICPDFVVELRSPSDRLDALQAKMAEYIENGARLGWLLDPLEKRVHLYRPDQQVETLDNPRTLTGHDQLEGLAVDLDGIL